MNGGVVLQLCVTLSMRIRTQSDKHERERELESECEREREWPFSASVLNGVNAYSARGMCSIEL